MEAVGDHGECPAQVMVYIYIQTEHLGTSCMKCTAPTPMPTRRHPYDNVHLTWTAPSPRPVRNPGEGRRTRREPRAPEVSPFRLASRLARRLRNPSLLALGIGAHGHGLQQRGRIALGSVPPAVDRLRTHGRGRRGEGRCPRSPSVEGASVWRIGFRKWRKVSCKVHTFRPQVLVSETPQLGDTPAWRCAHNCFLKHVENETESNIQYGPI